MNEVDERTAPDEDGRFLRLDAPLDIYQVVELKARLLQALAAADALHLDLSEVETIDTAGLQLLVLLKRQAAQCGRRLHLAGHSQAVRAAIELTNLAAYFGDPLFMTARESARSAAKDFPHDG